MNGGRRPSDGHDSENPRQVPEHEVIELAWSDDAPFEAIERVFGLNEARVIALMRQRLKPSSFRLWRARVSGRASKHSRRGRLRSNGSAEIRQEHLPLPNNEDSIGADEVRRRWRELVEIDLPAAAGHRRWPVRLDHCFARILLDVTCGCPWRQRVRAPAWKNAPVAVLREAIETGEAVLAGDLDLGELNQRSLRLRGHGERDGSLPT